MNKQELLDRIATRIAENINTASVLSAEDPDSLALIACNGETCGLTIVGGWGKKLIESPPKWLDEPTGDGWYWVKPTEADGKELSARLRDNPCRCYWSPKHSMWLFDWSWRVQYDALQGRQVCPVQLPPQ